MKADAVEGSSRPAGSKSKTPGTIDGAVKRISAFAIVEVVAAGWETWGVLQQSSGALIPAHAPCIAWQHASAWLDSAIWAKSEAALATGTATAQAKAISRTDNTSKLSFDRGHPSMSRGSL